MLLMVNAMKRSEHRENTVVCRNTFDIQHCGSSKSCLFHISSKKPAVLEVFQWSVETGIGSAFKTTICVGRVPQDCRLLPSHSYQRRIHEHQDISSKHLRSFIQIQKRELRMCNYIMHLAKHYFLAFCPLVVGHVQEGATSEAQQARPAGPRLKDFNLVSPSRSAV